MYKINSELQRATFWDSTARVEGENFSMEEKIQGDTNQLSDSQFLNVLQKKSPQDQQEDIASKIESSSVGNLSENPADVEESKHFPQNVAKKETVVLQSTGSHTKSKFLQLAKKKSAKEHLNTENVENWIVHRRADTVDIPLLRKNVVTGKNVAIEGNPQKELAIFAEKLQSDGRKSTQKNPIFSAKIFKKQHRFLLKL